MNIPETDVPYKIPGTKIGIMTDKPISVDGAVDQKLFIMLSALVEEKIQLIKEIIHENSSAQLFEYESIAITQSEIT